MGVGTILLPAALTKCSLLDRGRLRVAAQGTLQIPWCGGAGEKLCLTFSCAQLSLSVCIADWWEEILS